MYKRVEKLKILRESVDWEVAKERRQFLHLLNPLISDWDDELPNLRDIFQPDDIECLLIDSIDYDEIVYHCGEMFIDFVARAGYKNEPTVDEDGKPLSRRTTAVHHVTKPSLKSYQCNAFVVKRTLSDLFKIYNRFDVNYTDELGLSHFHVACKFGLDDVVRQFLELGQVDPNSLVTETGHSPLRLAMASSGCRNKEVVKLLLKHGANPNFADVEGSTVLHLLFDINDEDWSKMLFEISINKYRPVRVNAQDKYGDTPLHRALKCFNMKLIELLLKNGANPNLVNERKETPLLMICKTRQFYQYDCNGKLIELLLRSGANPNSADAEGSTSLHMICQRGTYHDNSLTETFFKITDDMQQSVQADAQDKLGRTPLQLAVANLIPNVVDVLLDRGADVSNFVFPTESLFDNCLNWYYPDGIQCKFILASGALAIVEILEKRGYELVRSDALTIMKIFAKHGLFKESVDLNNHLYDDMLLAKAIFFGPSPISLYDLQQLPPKEAAKLLKYSDFLAFERWVHFKALKDVSSDEQACVTHLCEILLRGFFQRWALEFLFTLTRYQLPILCCEIIIEKLTNKDLYNICLAVTDQSS